MSSLPQGHTQTEVSSASAAERGQSVKEAATILESVHSHDKLRITGEEDKKMNYFCFQANSTLIGLKSWKNRII